MADLIVENPQYETIEVACKIKVRMCLDEFFYKAQLAEDLNQFLSPWIAGDPGKINFGGRLHVSQVIYFIEKLDYIDYVTNLTLKHCLEKEDDNHVKTKTELNIIEPSLAVASTSKSVLTSVGAHLIELV